MFLQVCVCPQGDVCLSACWDTNPLAADPLPLAADHPLTGDPPCGVHAGRYGQQADGIHPTGMESC